MPSVVVPPSDPSHSTPTSTKDGTARGVHPNHSTTATSGSMLALVPARIAGSGRCANATMTISGTHVGTRLKFLEKWSSGGGCLIDCQLSFCGNFFSGTYTDLKTGKSGPVEGFRTCLSWNTFATLRHVLFKSSLLSGMAVGKLSSSLVCLASYHPLLSLGTVRGVGGDSTGSIGASNDTDIDPSTYHHPELPVASTTVASNDTIPPSSDPITGGGGPTPTTPSHPAGGEEEDRERDVVAETHTAVVKWLQSDLLSGGLPMNQTLVAYLVEEVEKLIDPINDKENKGPVSVSDEDGQGTASSSSSSSSHLQDDDSTAADGKSMNRREGGWGREGGFERLTDWWIDKVFPILKGQYRDNDMSSGDSNARSLNQTQGPSSSFSTGKGPILTNSPKGGMNSGKSSRISIPNTNINSDGDTDGVGGAGMFLTDLLANRQGAQRLDEYVVHHIGQVVVVDVVVVVVVVHL